MNFVNIYLQLDFKIIVMGLLHSNEFKDETLPMVNPSFPADIWFCAVVKKSNLLGVQHLVTFLQFFFFFTYLP
jgi:hypothetical protein